MDTRELMAGEAKDSDDFEDINERSFPGASNSMYSVPADAIDRVGRTVAMAAAKYLPRSHPGKPLEYRFAVVCRYVEYGDLGAKRRKGEPYRTPAQHRLDTALTDVAAEYDRCESTIHDGCTRVYQSSFYELDEPESLTDAFREDCQQILEAVRSQE